VAATHGENLPATSSVYIERIANPAPRAEIGGIKKEGRAKMARPVSYECLPAGSCRGLPIISRR
jgi:hypothetical protein